MRRRRSQSRRWHRPRSESEGRLRIIFLHIPKTAGQSIHAALVNAFGKDAVCPARVNEQLRLLSVTELNRYQVFSGHLDWALLDCIKGPKYVFTVLREPADRILSFYFYLRDQGAKLTDEDRARPEHEGLTAAYEFTPNQYFMGGAPHLRRFLDDHYDNFYTYFFAGRHYHSRSQMVGLLQCGTATEKDLLTLAADNIALLDGVFPLENIGGVFSAIRDISGKEIQDEAYRTNVNTNVAANERQSRLRELGADAQTMARIRHFCRMDDQLWKLYKGQ